MAVANPDEFWPDVGIDELKSALRTPSDYEDDAVSYQITQAMLYANRALSAVKEKLVLNGYETFVDYIDVSGKDLLVLYYNQAIFCFAKHELLKISPSIGRSMIEEKAAEPSQDEALHLMKRYNEAINSLLLAIIPSSVSHSNFSSRLI